LEDFWTVKDASVSDLHTPALGTGF
jgi:hypothetical protein